jgi:hypothetical protein
VYARWEVPFEGELLMLYSFVRRRPITVGLGACPVCGPVFVAEDIFTQMRCI